MQLPLTHRAAALLATLIVSACSKPQTLSSTFSPGSTIVSFPNSVDRTWTSAIASDPYEQVSGVDGRALMVIAYQRSIPRNLFAVDLAGNVGARGAFSSASSRSMKKDIGPFHGDALGIIDRISFVHFRYKGEPEDSLPHVGFIAEETPAQLSGPNRDSFDINNALAINMAATQALRREILDLQNQLKALKAQNALKGHIGTP